MDDIVRQAMAKWPHVPHCYGWLGLDARGNWYMRDDRAQAAGPFASRAGGTAASKGSLLRHEKLIDFMLGKRFQEDMPLQMFVYPVVPGSALPDLFTKFAAVPAEPVRVAPEQIDQNREQWVDAWTKTVLR